MMYGLAWDIMHWAVWTNTQEENNHSDNLERDSHDSTLGPYGVVSRPQDLIALPTQQVFCFSLKDTRVTLPCYLHEGCGQYYTYVAQDHTDIEVEHLTVFKISQAHDLTNQLVDDIITKLIKGGAIQHQWHQTLSSNIYMWSFPQTTLWLAPKL